MVLSQALLYAKIVLSTDEELAELQASVEVAAVSAPSTGAAASSFNISSHDEAPSVAQSSSASPSTTTKKPIPFSFQKHYEVCSYKCSIPAPLPLSLSLSVPFHSSSPRRTCTRH